MDVFDHPWLSGLFGDDEMAALWSADAQLASMLAFEAAWSRAGHLAGLWDKAEGDAAAKAIEGLTIAPGDLAAGTGTDGVPVPALVKLLKERTGSKAIHTGATSQDLIDTALAVSMARTLSLMTDRLTALDKTLSTLAKAHGAKRLMGRTRMQAALEITVADRVNSWSAPFSDYATRASQLTKQIGIVQIGGPVGTRAALGDNADAMVAAVADAMGLEAAPVWHSRRDKVVDFAGFLSMITGSLGKMGQDIALMAQMGEISIAGGGSSSAMPHKQNPVLAELLVTLARFNATQISGVHHGMIHEQERSGAAWALEWMILPQMAMATGRALTAATELAQAIERVGDQ